jgi:hypothetical protein
MTPVVLIGAVAVHAKVTPVVVLFKVTKVELLSEQMDCDVGEKVTAGDGFTVIVKVSARLEQPLAVAVTDIVDVIAALPEFVGVNTGILPEPLVADNPIRGLEFVQA